MSLSSMFKYGEAKAWKQAVEELNEEADALLKEVAAAIAQLDSYLTWRDCKTALIYFVRRRDFLSVAKKMEGVLRHQDNISQVSMLDTNEYECFLASMSSPGQRKEMRVLMFNLSTEITRARPECR